MKSPSLLASLAVLLGLAAPASAALVADLQAPFTVAIKLTTNTVTPPRHFTDGSTELVVKFNSVRITARDFIEQLIEDGRIVGPAAGWRLVARTDSDSTFGIFHRLYAVKPGQPDCALDESALVLDDNTLMAAFRIRTRDEVLLGGRGSYKGSLTGTFATPVVPLAISALSDHDYTYRLATLGDTAERVVVPDSIRLELMGSAQLDEPPHIAEGLILFGKHRITAVRAAAAIE